MPPEGSWTKDRRNPEVADNLARFIVLISKSVWIRRTILVLAILISGGNLLIPRLPILFVIALLCLIARDWVIDFKRNMAPIFVWLAAVLVLAVLRPSGSDIQSTAIRYANFTAGVLLLDLYLHAGSAALSRDLYVVLRVMVWQALITVVLAQLFNFLFVPLVVSDTPYSTFLLLFNYHIMLEDSTSIIRPDGFFYEPGVFQIYLNIFLYLTLFVLKKWRQAIFAVAAVFSTQSTTGVVIAFTIVCWFIATEYLNRGSLAMRVGKMFVGATVIGALAFAASGNIKEKLMGESQGSYWARQYDLLTGLNVIAYYRASSDLGDADTKLPDRIIQDRGNSNGIIVLLYSIGIPLSIPFFVGMFGQRFFPNRILTGIMLVLSFFGESIIFTPFFLLIVFSGMLMKGRVAQSAQLAHDF
jgi:hypothetical protein